MTRAARRRRAAVMLALALASGGLAASRVERRTREVEARVGSLVPVVVARVDLRAGRRIRERDATSALAVRSVPARFVPPDALSDPGQAVGGEVAAAVPAGGYVTAGTLAGARPDRPADQPSPPRRGERAIEIEVRGGEDVRAAGPGARVDVLVTSEPAEGRGRTYLALEDAEVLATRPADPEASAEGDGSGAAPAGAGPATLATLRVTLRQAVFLAAAQSFARETRLLLRGGREPRRRTPLAVPAGSL
ncbi:MAG TPA: Flp pilus assembly protein CpaB [Thermoleophilaceae bacterium]|jgi:pilus assembly protein CpaB